MGRHREGFCQICGAETDVIVSAYRNHPFIDGRCYQELCFTCYEVPKVSEYFEEYNDGVRIHKDVIVYYNGLDQTKLHSLEEMMADGFGREESQRSIKAIKAAIKKGLPLPKPTARPIPIPESKPTPPPARQNEDMSRNKKKKRRRQQQQQQHTNKYAQGEHKSHRDRRREKRERRQKIQQFGSHPLQTDVIIREIDDNLDKFFEGDE